MSSRRKAVKARAKKRKFLREVIKNYDDKLDPVDGIEGVPNSELERKKAYYENQLKRL